MQGVAKSDTLLYFAELYAMTWNFLMELWNFSLFSLSEIYLRASEWTAG